MNDIINSAAGFLRNYSSVICMAWIASLLVLYGRELAGFAKSIAKSWHFIFRVAFFILVCGFGYGLLGVFLSKFLNKQMLRLDNLWLIVAVTVAFFLIGFLADRKKKI